MSHPSLTPLQYYQQQIGSGDLLPDAAQLQAVRHTQRLYEGLLAEYGLRKRRKGLVGRLVVARRRPPVKGIYLWGDVGRGKTQIIDAFFELLPFAVKKRSHFHRFMNSIHAGLRETGELQDPLLHLARRIADQTMVLCFDEFHVADITDAMLLGGLLDALFDAGVTLVATSNTHPERLYRDGLQRSRFLPAIDLILENTEVVNLDGDTDYRLRYLDRAEIYHQPLDIYGDRQLLAHFVNLAPETGSSGEAIVIEGRPIATVRCADGIVWFEFGALCDSPRGPSDYIEIGRQFQTVLLGNVPLLDDQRLDAATRFVTLVDEFYDRNVKLVITAAAPPPQLYNGQRLAGPFQRTASRLVEMQSHRYLASRHRP